MRSCYHGAVRTERLAVALLLALVACGLLACGGPDLHDVPVRWTFVDGRACAEAGVTTVQLQSATQAMPVAARCTSGQGGKRVLATGLAGGEGLRADALSASGAVLYRGSARLDDPGAAELVITLYYIGGT